MSNDIRSLIDQEIHNIDEMLKVHAYHRQALQELLNKIEEGPVVSAPRETKKSNAFRQRCRDFASRVADLVKEKDVRKVEAIRELIHSGEIDEPTKSVQAMISPANVGRRFHNKLFEGTRYGKQA